MCSLDTLTTINSDQFLNKIIKRGINIDSDKKKILISFEKKYRDFSDSSDTLDILNNDKIRESEKKLIHLFKKYNPNLNYISYILIINSLGVQDIKNLNRYIIINWNKTKLKFEDTKENKYIRSINFSEISTLENIYKQNEIINKFIYLIIEFVNKEKIDPNVNFSLYLLFIINSFQNYFCPSN